jgi:hypothetical protein
MSAELPLEDDPKAKFTTADIESMLWNRYTEKGEHAVIFNVPNVVGVGQSRRCDAVAIGMWQSSGRLIQGFEIKVSRSDWLREVKAVDKADPFIERCDKWWLVTADVAIAKSEEVPDAWGWLTATKSGLRVQRPARQLPQDPHKIDRLWAFALIRRASERQCGGPEWEAALKKERDQYERRLADEVERLKHRDRHDVAAKLQERIDRFEKASGMSLDDWKLGNVGKLAAHMHHVYDEGWGSYTKVIERQRSELAKMVENHDSLLAALAPEST